MREAGEAKRRILSEAEALFAERGYEGAGMDELARRAGVNKALIYYYFESKEKLLDAIAEAFALGLAADIRASGEELLAMLARREGDPAAIASWFRLACMNHFETRQAPLRIILGEAMRTGSPLAEGFEFLREAVEAKRSIDSRILAPEGASAAPDDGTAFLEEFLRFAFPVAALVAFKRPLCAASGLAAEDLNRRAADILG
jgi:AcrR family transcriptional regulator